MGTDEVGVRSTLTPGPSPQQGAERTTVEQATNTTRPAPHPDAAPCWGEGWPKAGVRANLTTEQKAALAALFSVDDDGLTNTQEQ